MKLHCLFFALILIHLSQNELIGIQIPFELLNASPYCLILAKNTLMPENLPLYIDQYDTHRILIFSEQIPATSLPIIREFRYDLHLAVANRNINTKQIAVFKISYKIFDGNITIALDLEEKTINGWGRFGRSFFYAFVPHPTYFSRHFSFEMNVLKRIDLYFQHQHLTLTKVASNATGQTQDLLLILKKCILQHAHVNVQDLMDFNYNSVAWSIGESNLWYDQPLKNKETATIFYQKRGFTIIPCDRFDVEIVMFCAVRKKKGGCKTYETPDGPYMFTHVVVYHEYFLNRFQHRWMSKFGSGPLLVHQDLGTIMKQQCSPTLSVGSPMLCFKKHGSVTVENTLLVHETTNPVLFLYLAIIPKEFQDQFEFLLIKWLTSISMPQKISSVLAMQAQGIWFERLLFFCQTNPAYSLPLIISKLVDPSQFMVLLLFRAMNENVFYDDFLLSKQEEASLIVSSWMHGLFNRT